MFLKKVQINNFKVLQNVELEFENEFTPSIFPLGSLNGGGKSTLLQLIFILLHCSFDKARHDYLLNILSPHVLQSMNIPSDLAKFTILHNNEEINLDFIITNSEHEKQDFKDALEKYQSNSQKPFLSKIMEDFKGEDLYFITELQGKKNILLCKTKANTQLLIEIANKVYLATPSTQIFLFFSQQEKQTAFKNINNMANYENLLQKTKNYLRNFFTYDFTSSTDMIIKGLNKAKEEDFKDELVYDSYKNHVKILKNFLRGKKITVDPKISKVIFKLAENHQEILPEDLSHGEQKKLGIYLWLKINEIEDSLVLMDEIEIGLHPDWQYEIVNELQEWSKNNQFILATHSYELCQALTPAHVKELEPKLIK